jgi:hypothetical protein
MAHALRTNAEAIAKDNVTLAGLFARYEDEVTAGKKGAQPGEDRRRMDVWQAWLATHGIQDPRNLDEEVLQRFVRARRTGGIVVPGRRLHAQPSDTTIGADIVFLQSVLNWATRRRVRGKALLESSPIRGFPVLRTKNPRRLWVTYDWYERARPFCDLPRPLDAQGLFGDFLDLLEGLGWRVTAICELRRSDIDRKSYPYAPFGLLHRRGEIDKEDLDEWVPLTQATREAVDRVCRRMEPAIGIDAYLFPAPRAKRAWTRQYVAGLLKRLTRRVREAQAATGGDEAVSEVFPYVNPHAFRRKWEEERRHLPVKDRMDASGRRDERSLHRSYLRRDMERVYDVMQEPRKLRGALVLEG